MSTYAYDVERPVVSLEKGLNISELLKSNETYFEINPDEFDDENTSTVTDFNFQEVEESLVNLDLIDVDENEDGDDGGEPFDKYRRKMHDIIEDGKLKKYIVKQGAGDTVPDNSLVYIRYRAYVEYVETPFDSTLLQCENDRDLAMPFNLARGELIPGLSLGILSMKKGEKAEFLIHPDLAYGKLGCPPRIPPEATVLFIVELERFVDCAEAFVPDDDLSWEQRNSFPFVHKRAKHMVELAADHFKSQMFGSAANKYQSAINMMHNARLANEQEELDRNRMLIKCYTNAMVCNHKMKKFKRVCILAQDAVKVDHSAAMGNSKLLYFWGFAQMVLCDYNEARKKLLRAQRLSPDGKDIGDALRQLEQKVKNSKLEEKMMWQRACNFQPSARVREISKEEEEFREVISMELKAFKDNPERDILTINEQFTIIEEEIVLQIAKDLRMYARVADGDKRIIEVKKPVH